MLHTFRAAVRCLGVLSLLACSVGLSTAARADILYNYEVTLNEDVENDVTPIVIYENDGGTSLTWPFTANAATTTLITNPFSKASATGSALLFGLISEIPGDDTQSEGGHLVLMMNTTKGAEAIGTSFETLFPNSNQTDLMNAVYVVGVLGDTDPGFNDAISLLSSFAQGDGLDYQFALGDDFSVIAFSDGVSLGGGTSFVSGSVVPEPSSLALSGIGLGIFGLIARRRLRRAA